jgi:hypothetical protein
MGDYVDAIKNINMIEPKKCHKFGCNFTLEYVAPMYEKYFSDVMDVYTGDGWYAEGNDIEALYKFYP